jgi:hypothetical protein
MEDFQQVFLGEIEWQSAIALEAMSRLRQSITTPDLSFFYIQAFLVAAANVSKLLWTTANATRGDELRKLLNVTDDSPIASKTLRNHFEHFDERIERWVKQSTRHNFIDRNVFSGGRGIVGAEEIDILRNLNSATLTITFWGETYNLPQVEEALKKVHDLAKQKRFAR